MVSSASGSDAINGFPMQNQSDSQAENQQASSGKILRASTHNEIAAKLILSSGSKTQEDGLKIPESLLVQCEEVLRCLSKYNTQHSMDGSRNIWILKPGIAVSTSYFKSLFK